MGAASSQPQEVYIETTPEDDAYTVVHVTDGVVNRIKKAQRQQAETQAPTTSTQSKVDTSTNSTDTCPIPPQLLEPADKRLTDELTVQQERVKSLEARIKQMERERRAQQQSSPKGGDEARDARLQAHYDRLKEMDLREKSAQEAMHKKLASTVERVSKRVFPVHSTHACKALEDKVLECYAKNPNKVYDCSVEAKAFTQCVNEYRYNMLNNELSKEENAQ